MIMLDSVGPFDSLTFLGWAQAEGDLVSDWRSASLLRGRRVWVGCPH
jgi:hypothetical protein